MKRRLFVKTSLLGTAAGTAFPIIDKAASIIVKRVAKQEFYELRVYTCKTPEQAASVIDYLEKAAIPALNRQGSQNIGVFKELKPADSIKLYVIIPFTSIEKFIQSADALLEDKAYISSGATYLTATASAPAYERIESSLLKAFVHMPVLAAPEKKARLFELRRYESPSELAAKKKIEMFNSKGEIDIFKRTGLTPVFFGETLVGTLRPNLTYMLVFDDMAAHDKNWKVFGSDLEWKKISSVPEYADAKIVSRITSTFLVPADCSQV